ncbi:uncharacterized protein PRCAT00005126001 [Priceomyces carsonii]|uniref:uncharacterized protein n=1 Tax=Priceomyces carsonii TaxID=28549 RepID=UPI002ED8FC9E|nr:unnamed protein product [Priceomyces carsonii]
MRVYIFEYIIFRTRIYSSYRIFVAMFFADLSLDGNHFLFILLVAASYLVKCVYYFAYGSSIKKIANVPEAKGDVAYFGHLKLLKTNHATELEKIGDSNHWEYFQVKFGVERILILHSFQAGYDIFVKNLTALIDRPLFYTFHKYVSGTQGLTVGTSPWDTSCKRRRIAITRHMTRTSLEKFSDAVDVETFSFIRDLWDASEHGRIGIDPFEFCQRMALNVTTMLCYATRFNSMKNPLLKSILEIVSHISSFRSTNNNLQDYVIPFRYLPDRRREEASEYSNKRDVWLNELFNKALERSEIKESLVSSLKDPKSKLDIKDLKSICVSLVSGGFETLASIATLLIAQICTVRGQKWQERAHSELMDLYGSGDVAWERSIIEEKCPFIVAFIKETLRYYAVIPLCPPRKTTKSFEYKGTVIPSGITVILNTQAANHDKSYYGKDADEFIPERWMQEPYEANKPPFHFTFGAGSRACPGILLSNRILFATFARLITLFKIKSLGSDPELYYKTYSRSTVAQTYSPKPFNVFLEARESALIERCLEKSKNSTQDLLDLSHEYI